MYISNIFIINALKCKLMQMKLKLTSLFFTRWFPPDPSEIDLQKESITLREAKVIPPFGPIKTGYKQ